MIDDSIFLERAIVKDCNLTLLLVKIQCLKQCAVTFIGNGDGNVVCLGMSTVCYIESSGQTGCGVGVVIYVKRAGVCDVVVLVNALRIFIKLTLRKGHVVQVMMGGNKWE